MRKTRRGLLFIALALVLALALAVAGCGSKKKSSSSGGGGGGTLTSTEIAAKSTTAMQQIKGATIGLDLSAKVGIDAAKISATNKALLKDPITINGTVKFNGTSISDMDLDATATAKAGTTYNLGAKITGGQGWLGLMGQWYTLPASYFSQSSSSPTPSASSSPGGLSSELQKLGIDPKSLITSSDLVGTDQIDGKDAYHISDKIDTNALATALSSLAQSSSLSSASASPSAAATIAALKSALKDAKIDIWYEKDNFYLRKVVITANMNLSSDPTVAAQGIKTVDLSITITLGNFDASVSVTPPTNPLPFDQLTNSLGSLTGSSTGL